MNRTTALFLVALPFVAGCSNAPPPPATSAAPASAASSPQSNTVAGKAPAGVSVVVILEPREAREFPAQTELPVMDQVSLSFGPDLLLVRTNEPAEFRNSDDTLHNVHVTHEESREPQFNVAIPTGENYRHTFKRDGFYRVGCDIHPAMAAAVFAAATPFSMLATEGRYSFRDVPAGAWRLTVFAAGRKIQRDIDVKAGVNEVHVE